jgi:hypothetical protein
VLPHQGPGFQLSNLCGRNPIQTIADPFNYFLKLIGQKTETTFFIKRQGQTNRH